MEMRKRKNIRLRDYDYRQCGGYFVTICTSESRHLLSNIQVRDCSSEVYVKLTCLGKIAEDMFSEIEARYPVVVDTYVIMPNHIHAVLIMGDTSDNPEIGRVIGAYKSLISKQWRKFCNAHGMVSGKIWQRGYYEHILRNREDYTEKCMYIAGNPGRWFENRMH